MQRWPKCPLTISPTPRQSKPSTLENKKPGDEPGFFRIRGDLSSRRVDVLPDKITVLDLMVLEDRDRALHDLLQKFYRIQRVVFRLATTSMGVFIPQVSEVLCGVERLFGEQAGLANELGQCPDFDALELIRYLVHWPLDFPVLLDQHRGAERIFDEPFVYDSAHCDAGVEISIDVELTSL